MGLLYKACGNEVLDQCEKGCIKIRAVHQGTGLRVNAQLIPGQCFKEFFQCADTPGQGNKTTGKLRHPLLAFVHGRHDFQTREIQMRDLHGVQFLGNHPDHLAAGIQRAIRDGPHDADVAAAVDEPYALMGQQSAELGRGLQIGGLLSLV